MNDALGARASLRARSYYEGDGFATTLLAGKDAGAPRKRPAHAGVAAHLFYSMMKWFCRLFGIFLLGAADAQSVLINEVVTSNASGLEDEDGDRPDWIELYNPGGASINLSGYGLSDNPGVPFKWRFPLSLVPARGFMVLFASGKDRTNTARLHTNFRLAASGEWLVITRPDSLLIDAFQIPALLTDLAFGRQPDGSSNLLYLATPTPRAANRSASGKAALHPPVYSHEAGWYADGFELGLFAQDPGSEIHYTLDGSEPTLESPLYTHPLQILHRTPAPNVISLISGTSTNNQHTDGWKPPKGQVRKLTVVRAGTFRDDALPSRVSANSFAVGPATNGRLPVISLSIAPAELFDFNRGIYMLGRIFSDWRRAHPTEVLTGHTPANYTQRGPDWERPAFLEYFTPDGKLAFNSKVRLDIQGQSSRSFRQKSLGIKTQADPISYELFPGLRRHGDGSPLLEFQHLRLRNSGNDWVYTMFRDALCHRLAEGLSIDTQAYRPTLVFLNGEFWGLHNLREQHDANYLASHYGLRKPDALICSGDGSLVDGPIGANQSFINLREFMRTHDLAVAANYEIVTRQIDVRNFILYHATCIYLGNADWPHNNLRVWRDRAGSVDGGTVHPRDGRWRWLLFDCDLAYGHPWSGGVSDPTLAAALSPTGRPGLGGDAGWSTILLRSFMQNPGFRREFINTSADLMNSWFREARAAATIETLRSGIAPVMPEHFARWQTQAPTNLWSNEVRVLTTFARQRPIILRQQYVVELHLGGYAALTVDVSNSLSGRVRVNRLVIDADLPGIEESAYPWRGWYFRDVPVELEALPNAGWEFSGWEISPASTAVQSREGSIQVSLTESTLLKATFAPARPRLLGIKALAIGHLQAEVRGAANQTYRVQSSADLGAWSVIGAITTDAQGQALFKWDTSPPGTKGFLRLIRAP